MTDELPNYFYGCLDTKLNRTEIADLFAQNGWAVRLIDMLWHEKYEVSSSNAKLIIIEEDPVLLMGPISSKEIAVPLIGGVLSGAQVKYTYESSELQDGLVNKIWENDIPAIKRFLDAGADPNHRGCSWSSAIACAAGNDETGEIIRLLVEAGANVNIRDESGATPLHHAVDAAIYSEGDQIDWRVVEVILSLGADPTVLDKDAVAAIRQSENVRKLFDECINRRDSYENGSPQHG